MMSDTNSTFDTSYRGSKRAPNPWPFEFEPVRAIGFPSERVGLGKMATGKEFGVPGETKDGMASFGEPAFGLRPSRQLASFRKESSKESHFFGESARIASKKRQKSQPRRTSRRIKHERTDFRLATNRDAEINNNTKKQSAETAARDNYYSSYSYGANNLSDRLNTGLQLDSPSPRGLTRNPIGGRSVGFGETSLIGKSKKMRQKEEDGSVLSTPSKQPPPSDTATRFVIESRRKEIRDGNVCFEETFSISFPKTLPSNVKIITVGQNFTS